MPSASAAMIAAAGCIFDTAMSATSPRGRPASRHAVAIAVSMRSKFSLRTSVTGSSTTVFFKVFLHFEGRRTAGAGRGNRLPVPAILHIATGEHTGHAGMDLVRGFNVAIVVQIDQPTKHLGIRIVPNAQKHGAHVKR